MIPLWARDATVSWQLLGVAKSRGKSAVEMVAKGQGKSFFFQL